MLVPFPAFKRCMKNPTEQALTFVTSLLGGSFKQYVRTDRGEIDRRASSQNITVGKGLSGEGSNGK